MCPLGRQRARPSKAPQVEPVCEIGGHWCRVIVFRGIGRLLNPCRRYYNIFVHFSRHFCVFFRRFCCFLPVMMSSGDRVSQRSAQLTSRPKYVMRVHTSGPNISWTRGITLLGLGILWPPCWRFGTIPNHGLTWRPCHSQNRRGLGDAQIICWTHMTWYQSSGKLRSKSGICLICPTHE